MPTAYTRRMPAKCFPPHGLCGEHLGSLSSLRGRWIRAVIARADWMAAFISKFPNAELRLVHENVSPPLASYP
jgi:hypothetical protein